ncbi:MAG: hypothetical protein II142_04085 [Bacteroidales bacterium]|nr:hypothetical protein [Bacteroidales bacterium]MBQ2525628.1 hypothetical protein [Bacteroidales bacterium]
MKVFLAAILVLGIGVIGMFFNIIFRKKDFPQSDVGANEEMRKRGIRCMKEVDAEIDRSNNKHKGATCSGIYSDACNSCGLYK